MKRHEILALINSQRQPLAALNVESLHLFGSAARDKAKPRSDVDFVVRFRTAPSFDQFMDLKQLLEDALGTRVDLVTERAIRPELRDKIERDAVRVA
ncbi:MAG: nucleotidyltransferase family protein [Rhizobiales bacterium]|nr:nucleotidyltransferase family protein [Hyphomicrobiales bacterium]